MGTPSPATPGLRTALLGPHPADAPTPLPLLFSRCHAVHTEQDALLATRDEQLLSAALALLLQAEAAVGAAAIFSANEDADDLATADLKYLLLPHYRAQLLAGAPPGAVGGSGGGGTQGRLEAVRAAQRASEAFLARYASVCGKAGGGEHASAPCMPQHHACTCTHSCEQPCSELASHIRSGAMHRI